MDPSTGDAPRAPKLPEPPSAGVLLDAVLAERQARLESIDAITNRAGILLGFTGAIVALTALVEHWWLRLLVFIPAAVTVGFSLATLKREPVPGLKPAAIREQLLMQPALGAQLEMLDFLTARHDELVSTIKAKAKRLGRATVALVVMIGALALAVILEGSLMSENDDKAPEQETVPPPPPLHDNQSLGEYFERNRQPADEETIVRKDSNSEQEE